MPKFAQESIGSRPQVAPDTGQQFQTQVIAQPVNTAVTPAENNLSRLANALNQVTPSFNRYFEKQADQEAQQQASEGYKAAKSGEQAVSPTAAPWFVNGFIKGTWENNAIQASNEALEEFKTKKDDPNFDIRGFLQQKMSTDLNGISNPEAIKIYSERFGAMSTKLQEEMTQHHVQQVMEQRNTDANVALSDIVSRLANPDHPQSLTLSQALAEYDKKAGEFGQLSITRPEMATKLFHAVSEASRKMNGNTELFKVFEEKLPGVGKSLAEMNPQLGEHIEKAKYQAQAYFDHYMTRQKFTENQNALVDLQNKLVEDPASITDEYLQSLRTPYGLLGQYGGYSHLYPQIVAQRNQAIQAKGDLVAVATAFGGGNGWAYPKQAQAYFDSVLGQDLSVLQQTLNNPDAWVADAKTGKPVSAAAVAMNNIWTVVSHTNAGKVPQQMERLGESVKLMVPSKDKDAQPPAAFLNIYEMYKGGLASGNSNLVGQMFDKEGLDIMDSFHYLRTNNVEPAEAWRRVFNQRSPEALELAQKALFSPEARKARVDAVEGALSGWFGGNTESAGGWVPNGNWLPNILRTDGSHWWSVGEGSYPKNHDALSVPMDLEAKRFQLLNPAASAKGINEHVVNWVKRNYVHDTTTNLIAPVKPNSASKEVQQAISSFSDDIRSRYKKDGLDGKMGVLYQYMGNGEYAVTITNESGNVMHREYPYVSHETIMNQYKYKTHLSPDEQKIEGKLDSAVRNGSLTLENLNEWKPTIDRMRQLDLLTPEMKRQIGVLNKANEKQLGALITEVQKLGITGTMMINPSLSTIPDLAAKKPVVQQMLKTGDVGGALTVMGEGVALKAYTDKAGKVTIGVGYNLDANAKTAPEDFRRAGIQFTVDEVRGGKAAISPEQAIRLYQVVRPRYEDTARKAFDGRYKAGEYDKLSGPEKAVLTDIAYQAGGNVANFTSLFDHMMTKNPSVNLHDALRLTYKDKATGKNVVDEHRKNLRLSVLLGRFEGSMTHAGMLN